MVRERLGTPALNKDQCVNQPSPGFCGQARDFGCLLHPRHSPKTLLYKVIDGLAAENCFDASCSDARDCAASPHNLARSGSFERSQS